MGEMTLTQACGHHLGGWREGRSWEQRYAKIVACLKAARARRDLGLPALVSRETLVDQYETIVAEGVLLGKMEAQASWRAALPAPTMPGTSSYAMTSPVPCSIDGQPAYVAVDEADAMRWTERFEGELFDVA